MKKSQRIKKILDDASKKIQEILLEDEEVLTDALSNIDTTVDKIREDAFKAKQMRSLRIK